MRCCQRHLCQHRIKRDKHCFSAHVLQKCCKETRKMRYKHAKVSVEVRTAYMVATPLLVFLFDSDLSSNMGMCGSRGGQGVRTPLKNHKNIGFSSNTGPDPLKNRSYQASIQCWAIIGTPAKRHSGIAYSGTWILPPLINTKKNNVVKVGPPLTKLSGSAHDGHAASASCTGFIF